MSGSEEQFRVLAEVGSLGVVPEDAAPTVVIYPDLAVTARRLGEIVARLDIFRRTDGEIVIFDDQGHAKPMTPRLFRTWITDFVVMAEKFDKTSGNPISTTLTTDAAATVLDCLHFKRGLRPLRGINHVRLPFARAGGNIELLPWGYDAESGIYTVPGGIDFEEDMDIAAAKGWLTRIFESFPFADDRSRSVQVAAVLSLFVRALPGGNALRPGFLWLANKPESGKSVLAKTAQYPVLGKAPAVKLKKDESADKEMEAFLRAGKQAIFLDNIYGGIFSATIDQLITNSDSAFRAMGGHELTEVPNSAQLFVTGNSLKLNEDAARRFLVIDLFEKGDPKDRAVADADILDDETMRSEEWRARMLAIAWALVRHWEAAGRPEGSVRLGSFEKYSRLLGGIVESAGYMPPFTPPVIPDAINPEKQEFEALMVAVLAELGNEPQKDFTLPALCALARANQIYEAQVGTAEEGRKMVIKEQKLDKEEAAYAVDTGLMTRDQQTAFSLRLKKKVGTEAKVGGVTLEFGKRTQARHSTWTVRRV